MRVSACRRRVNEAQSHYYGHGQPMAMIHLFKHLFLARLNGKPLQGRRLGTNDGAGRKIGDVQGLVAALYFWRGSR